MSISDRNMRPVRAKEGPASAAPRAWEVIRCLSRSVRAWPRAAPSYPDPDAVVMSGRQNALSGEKGGKKPACLLKYPQRGAHGDPVSGQQFTPALQTCSCTKRGSFLQGNGRAVIESLHLMAVVIAQKFDLLMGFSSLCDDHHPQPTAHFNNHGADRFLMLLHGRSRTKQASIFRAEMGSSVRWVSWENPVPKSSSEKEIPSSRSSSMRALIATRAFQDCGFG